MANKLVFNGLLAKLTQYKVMQIAIRIYMEVRVAVQSYGKVVFAENLGYSVSETSLRKEFSNFGEIAEVKLVKDIDITKRPKAYAFIQYTCQDDAVLALENMDRERFDGRLIYIEIAKPGKHSFGEYPKASGPPKKENLQEQDEVSDCWY
ncbi:hypothetical protein JCGZ_18199 [Jatropha curcas]|uniref:RRM domain-containing protein n=1 Tax=Jatropha curcas TaxID=180498 RepID=A0A067K1S0_JATCU|nr:hypothetical protein JCGZ_18199 [Jatropha curcas]